MNKLFLKYCLVLFCFNLIDCSALTYLNNKSAIINSDSTKIKKEIAKGLKKGAKYFAKGPLFYDKAYKEYATLFDKYNQDPVATYKYGVFLLHCQKGGQRTALEMLLNAKKYGMSEEKLLFYLGVAYHQNSKLDSALTCFLDYKRLLLENQKIEFSITEKKIKECKSGITFMEHPVRVKIDTLTSNINSDKDDYAAFFTLDYQQLYFTSRRSATTGGKLTKFDATYFEDIYYSEKKEGQWQEAINLPKRVNKKTNDAITGLSIDGQDMFIYRDINNGDIYISHLKKDSWGSPKPLKEINTRYHESSACFSPDQSKIYFISDRPEGFGGKDIYVSSRIGKRSWSDPVNLGASINSKYDETTVYIHPIGDEIYFSSKGHNSMGGYDVFRCDLNNGIISNVQNLGYPINSVGDEISYIPSLDEEFGFYAAQNKFLNDKDLYRIDFFGPEVPGFLSTCDHLISSQSVAVKQKIKEPKIKAHSLGVTILKGTVTDAVTGEPIEAEIEIVNNDQTKLISTFTSNGQTGKYLFTLKAGAEYGIAVKAENYMFYSENIKLKVTDENNEVTKDIQLNKFEVGNKIILNNIFFDHDKFELKEKSIIELVRLLDLLNSHNNIVVEISGHTDNSGTDSYNIILSKKRAQAVESYLKENGISENRMISNGYGEHEPVSNNNTLEGRALNRRTEFKIIRVDYDTKRKKTK